MSMNLTRHWRSLAALVLLAGCSEDLDAVSAEGTANGPVDEPAPDVRRGWIVGLDGPMQVSYEVRADGSKLMEGDIVLDEVFDENPAHARAAVIRNKQWPGAVVPYAIEAGMADQARVTAAVAEWNANTPYQWVVRTNQSAYVYFKGDSTVCESAVGRQGGRQDIKLAPGCDWSAAAHEMGHAVGFFHEQSRKDRDSFINIVWSNVKAAKKFNFDKIGSDADDWGVYDASSIMHYPSFISDTTFVNDPGIATITLKNGSTYASSANLTNFDRAAAWYRADVSTPAKTKWNQVRNVIGWPTERELPAAAGGTYVNTEWGRIFCRSDVGAREVHGSILAKYDQYGAEWSFLGYPTTDETSTPDGVGRYNHFQAGSIYWHPDLGAFVIYGLIRQKWADLGWERSWLGYPTTDETGTPDGVGRFNHFQNGSIYYTPWYGTFAVATVIRDAWAAWGWERGCLGYPVADQVVDELSNGWIRFPVRLHQYFAGGWIDWTLNGGAAPHCY
jgi:uncharacterized protein with LGFP repeats